VEQKQAALESACGSGQVTVSESHGHRDHTQDS